MKNILFRFLFLILIPLSLYSQNSNLTIMCVAAHPDDEDGATLAYYSKLKGYNAYTIFYTRGEGGQNEIGPELNDELGKIREQECDRAAAILGSHDLFLGELDFGFSKTAKETFKMWGGKDSVLARIVYFIRKIKPDVVISNHDTITTKPNRQHGNHQAVGITIYDAFEKAADRNYHPEQLTGDITPWQIKKLYFLVYDTTRTNDIFTIDVFEKDAEGKTINQTAIDALSQHKTQGMDKTDWSKVPEVSRIRHYALVRSDKMYPLEGNDLFTGLADNEVKPPAGELRSYKTLYNYPKKNKLDPKDFWFNRQINIGLVKTYDNSLEDFFKEFKIKYDLIDSLSMANGSIRSYDVILLDLRTYLYRKDVLQYDDRIRDYIDAGGNVICFYNKPSDWNIETDLAPYPISITNLRVTEEDAPVTILKPEHQFFNSPNKMTASDWNGWVQERNIYLPSDDTMKTSSKYERLLAMQDEGDPVPSTSLLWTTSGMGTYTYCSLALYRQLKLDNPGAIKLFLNMLSQELPMKKALNKLR